MTTAEKVDNRYYQKLLENFTDTLDSTDFVIARQTEGLTHQDTLVQLPFRGNCMNWVLGHIVSSRGRMLKLLGEVPVLSEEESARYITGSEAITDGEQALSFEQLMTALKESNARIKQALERTSAEAMNEITNEQRQRTRLDELLGLAWHETYHSGQFEYLRQAAGKNDKVF